MANTFSMKMTKTGPLQFQTEFDQNYPNLMIDEPVEGGGSGLYPNPSRILTAAVMSFLSSSFAFCLEKSRISSNDFELTTTATTTIDRNEQNRLRVKNINVEIKPVFKNEANVEELKAKFQRCVSIFQDYCTVSASIKQGIDITTNVVL